MAYNSILNRGISKQNVWSFGFLLAIICIELSSSQFVDKSKPEYEDFLRAEDFENARNPPDEFKRVPNIVDFDLMYSADKFQGDISNPGLTVKTMPMFMRGGGHMNADTGGSMYRSAVLDGQLWPNNRVPYAISSVYEPYSRAQIAKVMKEYEQRTCLKFVPKSSSDTDYIYIKPVANCTSHVGRKGGRQIVSLVRECIQKGVIIHELMHAIGFWHEQSRTDRDQYVTILWDNIQPDMKRSIMHYVSRAFGIGNRQTIVPKERGVALGQRKGFSEGDLIKINTLYNCDGKATTTRPIPECRDEFDRCFKMWELDGWSCSEPSRRGYMQKYCKKTCSLCDSSPGHFTWFGTAPRPTTPTHRPTPTPCEDRDREYRCKVFKQIDRCHRWHPRKNCRKTCGHC